MTKQDNHTPTINIQDIQEQVEREIARQVSQMNRRFDRASWFYLVLTIALLFGSLYLLMTYLEVPVEDSYEAELHISEEVKSLEYRINQLESQLDEMTEEE